ncbi:sugar porter family MFS transporter [Francisella frigiditurris]|uniref:MFS transporter, sugar porter family protein n=1 Tax=Francisella frigiditurris TaxID=1542390 RepID=A0A1J0KSP2_9GAMM|nr:sugar porter family MFS transporter [Francisella frigiditurris]APC96777.1 MFS transporter, sugar porter family protein [Francisella frigiditurris]
MDDTNRSTTLYVAMIVAIAAIGGLLFGFDTSIIAGATPFIQNEFTASNWQIEIVVSFCVLGAFFGALLSGYFTDRFGRKRVMIATSLLFIVGTLVATFAPNIACLVVGRFMLGSAIGIASYAVPLFIAEVAPASKRGSLVLWNGAFLTGGQVIAFVVNYLLTSSGDWRLMIATGLVPAILLFIGMCFMPYSPKWLVSKGRKEEAKETLTKLRDCNSVVKLELKAIQENLAKPSKVGFLQIFDKKVRPVLYIGLALGIFQQFFGINTVMYYGPHIMESIGFNGNETRMLMTLVLGIVNFIATIITIMFIDKLGRRRFLLIGSAMAAISLFSMIYLLKNSSSTLVAYSALTCLLIYVVGYCISVGSLFWLIISEIFPLNVRGTAMSFVASIQWLANFIVAATFLTILTSLGVTFTFGLYACVATLAFIVTYFFIPETKGVSLEVIEANLNRQIPTRYLGIKEYNK